jgi:hypothetical protein
MRKNTMNSVATTFAWQPVGNATWAAHALHATNYETYCFHCV